MWWCPDDEKWKLLGVRPVELLETVMISSSGTRPVSTLLTLHSHSVYAIITHQLRFSYRTPSFTQPTDGAAPRLGHLPSRRRKLSKYFGSTCEDTISDNPNSPNQHQTHLGRRSRFFQEAHSLRRIFHLMIYQERNYFFNN